MIILENVITLYLIRHARQSSPLCNVNVELAKEGIRQSKLLGQKLKAYNIDEVYSSHLIRAVMTADIVRNEIDTTDSKRKEDNITEETKECGVDKCDREKEREKKYQLEDLRETDFGELTGLPDSVLRVKYADYYAARDLKREDLRIPGGENGEEVYIRMNRAMESIIDSAVSKGYKNIAVISHGGAIRCYLAGLLSMPQSHRFMIAKNMENTAITEIRYNIDTKVYSVEKVNDYSHLEGHDELLRKHFKEQGFHYHMESV